MDVADEVLGIMRAAAEPLNAGKITELGGLDRKDVDKCAIHFIWTANPVLTGH